MWLECFIPTIAYIKKSMSINYVVEDVNDEHVLPFSNYLNLSSPILAGATIAMMVAPVRATPTLRAPCRERRRRPRRR